MMWRQFSSKVLVLVGKKLCPTTGDIIVKKAPISMERISPFGSPPIMGEPSFPIMSLL
jgi:hypothetical protein